MNTQSRPEFAVRELFYLSNLLTLARLLLLPTALRAIRQPHERRRALLALGVAMLTDALDGPVARRRHEVSAVGEVLDPIVDKLLIDSTALALTRYCGFPRWVVGLLLARDSAILIGALLIYRRRDHIATAQPTGKATTLALTAAMLLYIADGERSGRPALYAALLPFLGSLVAYLRTFWRMMRAS